MRAAKKLEDDTKGAVISIYVPRVSISPRSSAALRSHAVLESRRNAEADAAPVATYHDHADSCNAPEAKGIPAKLLAHDFIDNLAADTLSAPKFATSPPATLPNRRSPSPPPQPSFPARDVGGTVYYKPPLQSHTHTSKSDLLVHRLKSFLPSATRPPTRACKSQAGSGAEAVKLACNGPALDRFPLSVQGGLTSDQVKRAHTPAYEPRVAGQERQPLTQTWLVPNSNAKNRLKVPPLTFHPSEALGWEAFRRVEHKDAAREPSFARVDRKAPMAACILQQVSPIPTAKRNASHAEGARRQGQGCSSARWGNPPASVSRSAFVSPAPKTPSDLQLAIGGSSNVAASAPFVVSAFKKAIREWDAASAATADPFVYISAKMERVTCSPLPTRPPTSHAVEHPAANEAEHPATNEARAELLNPTLCGQPGDAAASRAAPRSLKPSPCGASPPPLAACVRMKNVRWADPLGSSVPPIFFAADEGTQFKEAASFVFAAAERASPTRSTGSPHTVRISEHGSAFDGAPFPYPLSPGACSSPSSTSRSSRSVAYRPVLADQIRAAILYARPHTLASAQRQGCLMQGRLEPTAGRRRMPLDPFKKVVIGRAVTAPLLQSSQATAVAHARADAVVPAASKAFSPDSSAARSSPGYLLNSANCRDPVLIYRVAAHGQPGGKVKPRDSHLTAVHSLADVLELNPVLASTTAAMQLPTRTKEMLREIELLPPHSNHRTSCALAINNMCLSS